MSAYDPAHKTWRKLPATPLTPRSAAAGAWTGTELVVAGGVASPNGTAPDATPATDGAAWVAATNTWHRIAAMPKPLPAFVDEPFAAWTGSEVLVWSSKPKTGSEPGQEVVLAYNPTLDRWRQLPSSGLTPRAYAVTIWTGKELVVWGGLDNDLASPFADGARLDPTTGTWRRLPGAPVPARGMAAAVWSDRELLVWGGQTAPGQQVGQPAAYDPDQDRWRALPLSPLRAKARPAGVWTGQFFIVIGGATGTTGLPAPGPGAAAYDPAANTWTALPAAPAYPPKPYVVPMTADQRADGLAVWTGNQVVLIGGFDYTMQASRPDGLIWTPAE